MFKLESINTIFLDIQDLKIIYVGTLAAVEVIEFRTLHCLL